MIVSCSGRLGFCCAATIVWLCLLPTSLHGQGNDEFKIGQIVQVHVQQQTQVKTLQLIVVDIDDEKLLLRQPESEQMVECNAGDVQAIQGYKPRQFVTLRRGAQTIKATVVTDMGGDRVVVRAKGRTGSVERANILTPGLNVLMSPEAEQIVEERKKIHEAADSKDHPSGFIVGQRVTVPVRLNMPIHATVIALLPDGRVRVRIGEGSNIIESAADRFRKLPQLPIGQQVIYKANHRTYYGTVEEDDEFYVTIRRDNEAVRDRISKASTHLLPLTAKRSPVPDFETEVIRTGRKPTPIEGKHQFRAEAKLVQPEWQQIITDSWDSQGAKYLGRVQGGSKFLLHSQNPGGEIAGFHLADLGTGKIESTVQIALGEKLLGVSDDVSVALTCNIGKSANAENYVFVYNIKEETAERIAALKLDTSEGGHFRSAQLLGPECMLVHRSRRLTAWRIGYRKLEELWSLEDFGDDFALHVGQKLLAIGTREKKILVIDCLTGQIILDNDDIMAASHDFAFSENGKVLMSEMGYTLSVWDLEKTDQRKELNDQRGVFGEIHLLDNDLFMTDMGHVFDLKLGFTVAKLDFVNVYGGPLEIRDNRIWLRERDYRGDRLCWLPIPLEEIEAARRDGKKINPYILGKGNSVSVKYEISGVPKDKVQKIVETRLAHLGVNIAPNQPIRLVVASRDGKENHAIFKEEGPNRSFDMQTFTYVPLFHVIEFWHGENHIDYVYDQWVPSDTVYEIEEGVDTAQFLRKARQKERGESYVLFEKLKLPTKLVYPVEVMNPPVIEMRLPDYRANSRGSANNSGDHGGNQKTRRTGPVEADNGFRVGQKALVPILHNRYGVGELVRIEDEIVHAKVTVTMGSRKVERDVEVPAEDIKELVNYAVGEEVQWTENNKEKRGTVISDEGDLLLVELPNDPRPDRVYKGRQEIHKKQEEAPEAEAAPEATSEHTAEDPSEKRRSVIREAAVTNNPLPSPSSPTSSAMSVRPPTAASNPKSSAIDSAKIQSFNGEFKVGDTVLAPHVGSIYGVGEILAIEGDTVVVAVRSDMEDSQPLQRSVSIDKLRPFVVYNPGQKIELELGGRGDRKKGTIIKDDGFDFEVDVEVFPDRFHKMKVSRSMMQIWAVE